MIVNPGGTNERFARANVRNAEVKVHNDNVTIFDEIAKGDADLMMTDSSETLYQQKLHPGVLCAVHPGKPFDFRREGLLAAARRRAEGLRRPVAAHRDAKTAASRRSTPPGSIDPASECAAFRREIDRLQPC